VKIKEARGLRKNCVKNKIQIKSKKNRIKIRKNNDKEIAM